MSSFHIAARELPSTNSPVVWIVIGSISAVLVISLLTVIIIFQRRRTKRDNLEWTKDPQELDDYGMGSTARATANTTSKTANVSAPPEAHYHERLNKDYDGGAGLGVPNNRISVDSTVSLARQLRQHDDTQHAAAQVPRSLV